MTAPASAPALRIFAGTTEGRLLCEWASGAGIPARAYAATEYGGELLGELPGIEVHAGRLDEADMERELPARASSSTPRTPSLRSQAATSGPLRSPWVHDACALRARSRCCPKASCRSRRSPARRAFSPRTRVARFSRRGSKELAPYTRVADFAERFFVRVLPLPGAITKCIDAGFSPSHVIGMQGPFTRELNEAMLRQVGASGL